MKRISIRLAAVAVLVAISSAFTTGAEKPAEALDRAGVSTSASMLPLQLSASSAGTLTAGYDHSCMLSPGGGAKCWGSTTYNPRGQLGTGSLGGSPTPVDVLNLSTAVSISANTWFSCAAMADGTARCWGTNEGGQLGNGTTLPYTTGVAVPAPVVGLTQVEEVSTGNGFACAALSTGEVRCWGIANHGRLGNGSTTGVFTVPVAVSGIASAVSVTAGGFFACALMADTTVRCWGDNEYGQLGDGTTQLRPTPVTVPGLVGVTQVSAGLSHACALLSDGQVKCWGSDGYGQLGRGFVSPLEPTGSPNTVSWLSTIPVSVVGLTAVAEVTTGANHSCGRQVNGETFCWGSNREGQLGLGNTSLDPVPTPQRIPELPLLQTIDAGWWHTCALLFDGTVRCWGPNHNGQLGTGHAGDSLQPSPVVKIRREGCAPVALAGLGGWWPGDGNSSSVVGPQLTVGNGFGLAHSQQGFSFSGGSALAASEPVSVSSQLTLEMWLKPTPSQGTVQSLVSRWSGPGFSSATDDRHSYTLDLYPNAELVFETDDTSTRSPVQVRATVPQIYDGELHHVAARWTQREIELYVDGTRVASSPSQGGILQTGGSSPIRVGGPFPYRGLADEVTIWSRALAPSEVATIATSTGPKCP
jgi:alpha-tubulin suppressor-like RCC1 family protein